MISEFQLTVVHSIGNSARMSTEAKRRPRTARQVLQNAVGVVDRLVAPHGVDRYLELVRPTWSTTDVRAKVVAVDRSTPGSVTLTLRPNGNWGGFTAGQHSQLTVEIGGVRQTRCYSMANSAQGGDGTIELTVRAHPGGVVSSYLNAESRPGLVVGLSRAQGEFTLPKVGWPGRPDRLLLVSGGSGITPVMSMLRTLCDQGSTVPITFLHYALTEDSMIYRQELEALAAGHGNIRLVRVFTDAPGTGDLDGFLTAAQLDAADPDWASTRTAAFVCGPAPLMDAARALYAGTERPENLRTEAFTLAQFAAEAGATGSLRLRTTGSVVENDGGTILAQAEAQGLSPLTGCRMGICHTCTRNLCSGVVRDAVTGDLTAGSEGLDTEVRICVSVPVGDVEIDL
jgi:ferredoxin-NADP reductase